MDGNSYIITENDSIDVTGYKLLNKDEGLKLMDLFDERVGFDSEAADRKFRTSPLLMMQFSNGDGTIILVDCTTVSPSVFKDFISNRYLVSHNAKNDLCFLYSYGIIPKKIFCTFIAEKLMNMGMSKAQYSLASLVTKYCNEYIDKSQRGKIAYQGIIQDVADYCANDVRYILKIYSKQIELLNEYRMVNAMGLEMLFLPVLAYIEWCGVRIDAESWKKVISENEDIVEDCINRFNNWIFSNFPKKGKLCSIDRQGDLFEGFRDLKKCHVKPNRQSDIELVRSFCDENQGEELSVYVNEYNKAFGLSKSLGKVFIDNIDKTSGRIHCVFNQLTSTGRLSCPQKGINSYGHEVDLPSVMNLPKRVRHCIIPEDGNVFITADWISNEMCILAYLSKSKKMLDIVRMYNGDVHSYMSKIYFSHNVKLANMPVEKVRESMPEYRDKAKTINFTISYLGSTYGMVKKLGINEKVANSFIRKFYNCFPEVKSYQDRCTGNILFKGYIPMNDSIGYKIQVEELERLRNIRSWFNNEFWKNYSKIKAVNPNDMIVQDVKWYVKRKGELDRLSIDSRMQCTGSIMLKMSLVYLFKWIKENNLFGIVKVVIPLHDSITVECPCNMVDTVSAKLKESMSKGVDFACHGLVIPIDLSVCNSYQ